MQLVELPELTLRDLAPEPAPHDRSAGVHLTDITGLIMSRVDKKRYGRGHDPKDTENWQEAGFLWENILGGAFSRKIDSKWERHGDPVVARFRPGEIRRDHVIGSPDSLAYTEAHPMPIVEEFKATWKSCEPFGDVEADDATKLQAFYDSRFLGYLLQLQGYCAMLGTLRARIAILFINSDYQAFKPRVRAFDLLFTSTELEEQWSSFLSTARKEKWL